jgi:calcium/calmodulin-dependent protein kinase I
MTPPKSDIDHWQIPAIVYDDRVEETHFVTDAQRNVRRQERKVVWHREKLLGRGGFGEVRLESNREENKSRAVKKITTGALSHSECQEELKALLEFSKPKVSPQPISNSALAYPEF